MLALAFVVGIIGGAYGIGGGAVIAPFCIAVFHLPVAVVAGAALAGTFATSVIGSSSIPCCPCPMAAMLRRTGYSAACSGWAAWPGMYLGATTQKRVPQKVLKMGLGLLLTGLAASYLLPALV